MGLVFGGHLLLPTKKTSLVSRSPDNLMCSCGSAPEMRVATQIIHPGVGAMEGKKGVQVAWGSIREKSPPSTEGLEDMKND